MQPHLLKYWQPRFAALGAAALLTVSSSSAGTITVVNLPSTGTDAATGISTTNSYLCCIDFGNNTSPPGNINGVLFQHPDLGNQAVNTTNGVDSNYGGSYTITSGGSAACAIARTTSSSPTGQADGNTWKMLNDTIYTGSSAPVNSWLNQTYGGLGVGRQYSLRIYYRQWATTGTRAVNVTFNGEGSPEAYGGNPVNEDSGGAHYIEYLFTAASTNVFVGMTNLYANESAMVYGVTLQDNSPAYAPVITTQPSATMSGSSLVFNLMAMGTAPLSYRWCFNATSNYIGATVLTDGSFVSGSTTPTLTTSTNLKSFYFAIVTNNYGAVTSAITAGYPQPFILAQPSSATDAPGASVQLSVSAGGIPPLAFQWSKDGTALAGATNSSCALGYLHTNDAGAYQVIVTNAYGAATSSVALLTVAGPVPPPPDFTATDSALVAAAARANALAALSDSNQATMNWSARWIAPSASSTNLWLCYRKTFSLQAQPANALARIAADSKYWLWVNGQIVVREGELKRAVNPSDTWYDQIDLARFLQSGSNTIALLQWHFGKSGFSHTNSGAAGLLFEMNAGGTLVQSDTTWRMVTNSAFQLATTVAQPNYRISEGSLRYDARLDLGAWTNQVFDDSAWSTPTDRGAAGALPWGKLWLRSLPFWQELPLQDFASTTISGNVWTCYLPVNEQFTPWLDVSSASPGLIISIVPDTVASTASPGHEYVTRTGRQSFEFPAWISGHFVQFTVPSGVTVYGLKFRPHLADTQRTGRFECDDPFFNVLWNKAANTVGVNMMEVWGETRERANWIGDSTLLLDQAPYAYDAMAGLVSRKSFLEMIHWQRTDNTLFAPAPANNKELPVQVLAALGQYGVLRHYLNTGDLTFLKQCYPALKSYLLGVWQMDSSGLVIHRAGQWDWEDWGDNIDKPLLDNAWYLLAMDAAAQIAPLVGQSADAALYAARAQGIRKQYNASFWTPSGYRSSTYAGETDERGNAMAVLAGLTAPTQASTVRTVLVTQQHCSPYMEKYVLEALFALGFTDDALARMRSRYSAMVSSTSTTLWENFPATGGFNHGWSGGPLTLLDEEIAGVTPTAPGFAAFDVRPILGATLARADADVPSPVGLISVSAARNLGGSRLSVRVPPGSSARAFQPTGGLLSGGVVSIDGDVTTVMDDTVNPSEINVTGGNATLISNLSGAGYLKKTGAGAFHVGASSLLSIGGLEVAGGQIVVDSGGQLTVAGGVTNQGTMRLLGSAQLNIGGAFSNGGTLDIMTWSGTLPAGFVNDGMVLDRSAIRVQSCGTPGGHFELTIMGYAGHTYQLQSSNDMHEGAWASIGPAQAGRQALLTFADTANSNLNQRFYRVVLDSP